MVIYAEIICFHLYRSRLFTVRILKHICTYSAIGGNYVFAPYVTISYNPKMERKKRFEMRLTEAELQGYRSIADACGLSVADWIRLALKKAIAKAKRGENEKA